MKEIIVRMYDDDYEEFKEEIVTKGLTISQLGITDAAMYLLIRAIERGDRLIFFGEPRRLNTNKVNISKEL